MYEQLEEVAVERPGDGAVVVAFRGEHDLAERDSVERLLDSLIDEHALVVLDFSEATFVDSTMLHVILDADLAARRRGITLCVQLGAAAIVSRAFELSGVCRRLATVESREAALALGDGAA